MKTIINVTFLLVLSLFSCAKPEEIVLEKDLNSANYQRDYFPVNQGVNVYLDSQNGEDDIVYSINSAIDYTSFNEIADFRIDKSYVYGNLGGSYNSYYEKVSLKKDGENLSFLIEEKHNDVYPSYSSSYYYDIEKTPYELKLLKADLMLNQTWSTTQSVTTSYDGYYSYFPSIQDEITTVQFNYDVIEIDGEREINGITYRDLISIRVQYSSYFRIYTFSEYVGLVEFRLQDKTYLRQN